MNATSSRPTLRSFEEFFTSPQPCTAIDDVRQEMAMEREYLPDADTLRAMQDWSFLSEKVVGAEE